MLIFYTDETEVHGDGSQVYGLCIYGGLVLTEKESKILADFIYQLKDNYVLPQELDLKWRFEQVWENMRRIGHIDKKITKSSHPDLYNSLKEDYDRLKSEVINKISDSGAKIIIAIRPEKLLRSTKAQKVDYSIQAVSRKFQKLLDREKDLGIILADELPKRLNDSDVINYQYILKLCRDGSGSQSLDRLVSVVPTIDSCVSPIHQINDIILGVMQYYMLEFMRKLKNDKWDMGQAKEMFTKIKAKFYTSRSGGYIINSGILLYPPKINREVTPAGIFLNLLEEQLKQDFSIH